MRTCQVTGPPSLNPITAAVHEVAVLSHVTAHFNVSPAEQDSGVTADAST